MWDLLQFAGMLALPILAIGGLVWLLIYSAVRLALRHEVAKLDRRKRSTRPARAARPQPIESQPAPAHGNGRARSRTAERPAGQGRTQPLARPGRAAS